MVFQIKTNNKIIIHKINNNKPHKINNSSYKDKTNNNKWDNIKINMEIMIIINKANLYKHKIRANSHILINNNNNN